MEYVVCLDLYGGGPGQLIFICVILFINLSLILLKMNHYLLKAFIVATVIGAFRCSQQNMDDSQQSKNNPQHEILQRSTIIEHVHEEDFVFGTYTGTFPCADCGGKDIRLTISKDGTYCLQYKYQDKDDRQIEENGTYAILDETLVETITPSSGEKTYYKYVHGTLILSDSLGTIAKGERAELYVLKKTDY